MSEFVVFGQRSRRLLREIIPMSWPSRDRPHSTAWIDGTCSRGRSLARSDRVPVVSIRLIRGRATRNGDEITLRLRLSFAAAKGSSSRNGRWALGW